MPVVPVSEKSEQVQWECSHCDHTWKGKPKAMRTGSGNPTCSSCGRRSGARIEAKSIPATNSPDEADTQFNANEVLLAVLKLASDRFNQNQREVM